MDQSSAPLGRPAPVMNDTITASRRSAHAGSLMMARMLFRVFVRPSNSRDDCWSVLSAVNLARIQ
eukprot:8792595-Heterocapsa_arctica.AAC.1